MNQLTLEQAKPHSDVDLNVGRFIGRDLDRVSERDDFTLNVVPNLGRFYEAREARDSEGNLLGWRIQPRYS
jgi:hypothetical protein